MIFAPESNSGVYVRGICIQINTIHDTSPYRSTSDKDLFAAVASSVPTAGGSSCNGSSSTYIRSQFTSNLCPPSNNGAVSGLTGHSIDDLPPPGYAPSEGPPSTIGDLGRILKELLK